MEEIFDFDYVEVGGIKHQETPEELKIRIINWANRLPIEQIQPDPEILLDPELPYFIDWARNLNHAPDFNSLLATRTERDHQLRITALRFARDERLQDNPGARPKTEPTWLWKPRRSSA
jgi:hypothetical protein